MSGREARDPVRIRTPLDDETIASLEAGTPVLISGTVYGARDQAHIRMVAALKEGRELPFDPAGAVIYYVGPTPGSEGRPVGAAGPTTSSRMDLLAGALLDAGVKATIGKGPRTAPVKEAMRRNGAIYLAATGGAGALLGSRIVEAEVIAYEDLGCEAMRRLRVEDFPAIVAVDCEGRDIFEEGAARHRK